MFEIGCIKGLEMATGKPPGGFESTPADSRGRRHGSGLNHFGSVRIRISR